MSKRRTTEVLPVTAEERAYQLLRREILEGTFASGERLREEALAQQFGMSRTPVRAGLQRLASEGLVEFRRYGGAVVRVLPPDEIDQIYGLRAAVESMAAELAALRIGLASLQELHGLTQEMDRYAAAEMPDLTVLARLNRRFHHIILTEAGNLYARRVADNLSDLNFILRSYGHFSRVDLLRSMGHHRELVDAFRARNPAWARTVMISHVEAGRSVARAALDDTERPAGLVPAAG